MFDESEVVVPCCSSLRVHHSLGFWSYTGHGSHLFITESEVKIFYRSDPS